MATLIIDDPLLRPDYGFLNFERTLAKADELGCTVTIAFIPWNHRRSSRTTTELFRRRNDRLAICVHGCDHVASEFAATDLGRLNSLAGVAASRMDEHEQRSGLAFTRAMVFPQGRFSAAAMLSLKFNGYMAAVNTDVVPMSSDDTLTIGDFLDVAITKYHGFPLYRRRYPDQVADFPFMMFLGVPLLVVEHHGFFKGGFGRLESLMHTIDRLPAKPCWTTLSQILERTYKVRRNSGTEFECRTFSTRQTVHNPEPMPMNFLIRRSDSTPDHLEELRIDGRPVDFAAAEGAITTRVTIPAESSVRLDYVYRNRLPIAPLYASAKDRGVVRLRRYLSEFRDNVIARNGTLLSAATALKETVLSKSATVR